MSEEFKEDITKSEIIKIDGGKGIEGDGEHEGWGWSNFARIFRPPIDWGAIRRRQEEERRNRERALQEQRNREQRARDEFNRVRNMENQIRQLNARVQQLENIIRDKDRIIGIKNKYIDYLKTENTRLKKKTNSLLDNLQYYRTSVLGTDDVDGYKTTVVKQQMKIDELLQQEIGKPISGNSDKPKSGNSKKDGFENLYENFYKNENYDFDSLKKEHVLLEGFVDATTSSYNAIYSENMAIKNQIDNTTNIYSINNQLSANIIAKTNTLKYVNFILIIVFLIVYVYGCYKIYKTGGDDIIKKIIIGIVMFLTIFIVHCIEYILFNLVPYVSALILGTPYNPPYYWKKPGIYDYLPTP
uniref:Uncharacterized protein n=1 Tax=viral metagenome TaxID=1070528 RepID=A0A6C0HH78_9ZZZZ